MRNLKILLASLLLAACETTPYTLLKNPETGQTVHCGGHLQPPIYSWRVDYPGQYRPPARCVETYLELGFRPVPNEDIPPVPPPVGAF